MMMPTLNFVCPHHVVTNNNGLNYSFGVQTFDYACFMYFIKAKCIHIRSLTPLLNANSNGTLYTKNKKIYMKAIEE